MKVKEYVKDNGRSPFSDWLNQLDGPIKYRVQARIFRLREEGHFGVSKRLSNNLFELKFRNLGGGIRIYYGIIDDSIILLLCGGNKGSQEKDIKMAYKYWNDYLEHLDFGKEE